MSSRKYRNLAHPKTSNDVAVRILVLRATKLVSKGWFTKKRTLGRSKDAYAAISSVKEPSLRIAVLEYLGLRIPTSLTHIANGTF